jgi:hypothetical protein
LSDATGGEVAGVESRAGALVEAITAALELGVSDSMVRLGGVDALEARLLQEVGPLTAADLARQLGAGIVTGGNREETGESKAGHQTLC